MTKRDAVPAIVSQHSASRLRLFGSVASHQDGPGYSLLGVVAVQEELELFFGRGVDVRTLAGLHPSMHPHVLSQAIDLRAGR